MCILLATASVLCRTGSNNRISILIYLCTLALRCDVFLGAKGEYRQDCLNFSGCFVFMSSWAHVVSSLLWRRKVVWLSVHATGECKCFYYAYSVYVRLEEDILCQQFFHTTVAFLLHRQPRLIKDFGPDSALTQLLIKLTLQKLIKFFWQERILGIVSSSHGPYFQKSGLFMWPFNLRNCRWSAPLYLRLRYENKFSIGREQVGIKWKKKYAEMGWFMSLIHFGFQ